jgi:hypothetical protein
MDQLKQYLDDYTIPELKNNPPALKLMLKNEY